LSAPAATPFACSPSSTPIAPPAGTPGDLELGPAAGLAGQLDVGEALDLIERGTPAPPPAAHFDAGEGLGAAAERMVRLTLRDSPQTQRTYRSVYQRFAAFLAAHTGRPDPPPQVFTADALAAYLDARERAAAPATIKKERAALVRLAKYLHARRLVDATELLLVPTARTRGTTTREALDAATWARVLDAARARLTAGPRRRTTPIVAARDLALVLLLGGAGLRSEEARRLSVDAVRVRRADATRPWLRVVGKGTKRRELPLGAEVADALLGWERARGQVPELAGHPLLLPALGRQRRDGAFPDAGARAPLSAQQLSNIVKPIMLAAGVPAQLAHPHVLRHTYATLFLARSPHRLLELRDLLGHASTATTSVYLHTARASLRAAVDEQDRGLSVLEAHAARRAARPAGRAE
jgi:site-specific recombinase XerD